MKKNPLSKFIICGAGPSGLAAAWFLKKRSIPYKIYEKSSRFGGNARTFDFEGFSYDTGAHRLHDKLENSTQFVRDLLGSELQAVNVQSKIYLNGNFISFPPMPSDLLIQLGPIDFTKGIVSFLKARLTKPPISSFQDYAIRKYGEYFAKKFLLNYSSKLWGVDCNQLSVEVSGKRLKGINSTELIKDLLLRGKARAKHLDGAFLYPKYGIGSIWEELVKQLESESLTTEANVQEIHWQDDTITHVKVNEEMIEDFDQLICSQPLNSIVKALRPNIDESLIKLSESLRYRNLKLVCLNIDKSLITNSGSLYFPEETIPFTRIYEPKIRSEAMAPSGKSSLAIEIPCFEDEAIWVKNDEEVLEQIIPVVTRLLNFDKAAILGAKVISIPNAYSVLNHDGIKISNELQEYLKRFKNLHLIGRCSQFNYSHIHDLIEEARSLTSRF